SFEAHWKAQTYLYFSCKLCVVYIVSSDFGGSIRLNNIALLFSRQNPEATFEVYAEVTYPVATGTDPEVRRQFPEDYGDQEILQTLTKFCFPFYVDR
uniref:Uncharacterized protein n=1 Tax=Anolis carolinensis TaxID=28377 RepID=A0A803U164_ANOCA